MKLRFGTPETLSEPRPRTPYSATPVLPKEVAGMRATIWALLAGSHRVGHALQQGMATGVYRTGGKGGACGRLAASQVGVLLPCSYTGYQHARTTP